MYKYDKSFQEYNIFSVTLTRFINKK